MYVYENILTKRNKSPMRAVAPAEGFDLCPRLFLAFGQEFVCHRPFYSKSLTEKYSDTRTIYQTINCIRLN